MNRHHLDGHQQAYPSHGDHNREIGLRAVAAAIRYQGDANNVERSATRDPTVPAAAATQDRDEEA
jgi:hypothetical protein